MTLIGFPREKGLTDVSARFPKSKLSCAIKILQLEVLRKKKHTLQITLKTLKKNRKNYLGLGQIHKHKFGADYQIICTIM